MVSSDQSNRRASDPSAARGWYHRGYLPHYDSTHVIQSLTFRLADSLPAKRLAQLDQELLSLPPERRNAQRRIRIENLLDAGSGCCVLARPQGAWLVYDTLARFDGERYALHAWVIMPNHVHVLLKPFEGISLGKIMQSLKSWTGKRLLAMMPADLLTGSERRAWQAGYWDRFIRDQEHYDRAVRYIESNPVNAGLVARPEDWRWSSAYRQ